MFIFNANCLSLADREKITRFAKAFFIALIAATVLNGSVFWLKRMGWLRPEMRQLYYAEFHHDAGYKWNPEDLRRVHEFKAELYRPQGWEILFKATKDIIIASFILFSIYLLIAFRRCWAFQPDMLLLILLAFIAIAFFRSLWSYGPIAAIVGLRSFGFMFVACAGSWVADKTKFEFLVKCLLFLILLQALLAPFELWRGIHLFHAKFLGTNLGDRVVGTMLLPTSLGMFSVASYFFYFRFSEDRSHIGSFTFVLICLLYFSASATGWIMFFCGGFLVLYSRLSEKYHATLKIGAAVVLMLIVMFLPSIVGRWDVYDSLWGRIDIILKFFHSDLKIVDLLLGKGLGVGSNALNQILAHLNSNAFEGNKCLAVTADSTPMALLHQFGILGSGVFYLFVILAAWRDKSSWPIYAIFLISSLTVNIVELFPNNMLLGLILSYSLRLSSNSSLPATQETNAMVL